MSQGGGCTLKMRGTTEWWRPDHICLMTSAKASAISPFIPRGLVKLSSSRYALRRKYSVRGGVLLRHWTRPPGRGTRQTPTKKRDIKHQRSRDIRHQRSRETSDTNEEATSNTIVGEESSNTNQKETNTNEEEEPSITNEE